MLHLFHQLHVTWSSVNFANIPLNSCLLPRMPYYVLANEDPQQAHLTHHGPTRYHTKGHLVKNLAKKQLLNSPVFALEMPYHVLADEDPQQALLEHHEPSFLTHQGRSGQAPTCQNPPAQQPCLPFRV